jgi:HK97 family phage prohead protease
MMTDNLERKLLALGDTEFKFDAKTGLISGYASTFNGLDSYGDTILPGAFAETLENRERPVRMRWNHFGPVIGKWVEMRENQRGLFVKGELTPGHSVAEDVKASLSHGAIDGLSIGFYVKEYEVDEEEKRRTIKKADLVEISVVEEPADLRARVTQIKSAIDEAKSLKDFEGILRDAGLPRSTATALVSRMRAMLQGELEAKDKAAEIAAVLQRFHTPYDGR